MAKGKRKGEISMIEISNKRMSREYLENPFPKETYKLRLLKSKSIEYKENYIVEDFSNGYSNIKIVNRDKLIKK